SAITIGDTTYLLGAPDFVLSDIPHQIKERIEEQMALGKRVLLLAKSSGQIVDEILPENREALGLVILQDNIRPEAIETIKWFKENDVLVKIISGDDPVTVSEIARRAGVDGYDSYVNLFGLNEKEVIEAAPK
ncbi:MAG: HAD family hydrolase, partial [Clostridia bacterium]|nr:HAD family hydrolase [Clostridia bacterium]